MSTLLKLTETQLATLRALRDNAISRGPASTGAWSDFYQYLARTILTQPGMPIVREGAITLGDVLLARNLLPQDQFQSAIWLIGGSQVNSDIGAFSKIIRLYNLRQGQLRLGRDFGSAELQQASNEVGRRMAIQILGDPDKPTDSGNNGWIPTVPEIGASDLTGVRFILYPGNETPGSPMYLNQAWPGIIMLGKQGGQFLGRLIQTGDATKVDSLSDIQNLLFSWESFRYAFNQTGLTDVSGAKDFAIALGITNWQDLSGAALNISNAKWWFDLLTASQDAQAASALRQIHDVGSNVLLDMLIGAAAGKPQIGTTTDANFASRAASFFGAYGSALSNTIAGLLPADAGALASLARSDVNVRAALGALSVVSVQVNASVAAPFTLYNEATGHGNITDKWIVDRSSMLAGLLVRGFQSTSPISAYGTEAAHYSDSATLIALDIGSPDNVVVKKQISFGGDAADTLTGKSLADRLYGGAGNDSLTGQAGDDYLEANAGDDRLDGGAGDDTLMGGTGIDTYTIDANTGSDTVIDSDGQGRIVLAGLTLTGAGKLVAETADYAVWNDTSQPAAPITYRLDKAGRTLTISRPGNTVIVQNFSAGNLGISVPAKTVPPAPPQQTTFNLLNKADYDAYTLNPQANPASHLINAATAYDSQFDAIWVNSLLPQQTGVAHVFAPSVAGTGYSDLIEAGPGNAIQRIVISGRGGDDSLFASTASTLDAAVARGEIDAPSGKGWLWLEGGQGSSAGKDLVVGAAGDDVITAGTGDDTLSGGAGSDVIITDIEGLPFKTSGVDTMFTRWMTGQNNVATGAGPTLPVMLATYETADGARRTTSFANITVDPLQALDLSGLYAMRVQDLPGYSTNPAGPYRTYADLNGAGQNGYGSSVGGNDLVYGGAGNDAINVGAGKDTVFAGSGDDLAAGYDGDDFIDGGAGNDWLAGDYWAFAGNGRQPAVTVAVAGAAAYTLRATLDPARHGSDYIAGGAGNDLATSPRMMHSLEVGTAQ